MGEIESVIKSVMKSVNKSLMSVRSSVMRSRVCVPRGLRRALKSPLHCDIPRCLAATALALAWSAMVAAQPSQPRTTNPPNPRTTDSTPVVDALVRTAPVGDTGDAADDPAIWIHPSDPSLSLLIGTNKQRGLMVYDLQGRLLQALEHGRLNNVDVRQGFKLQGRTVDLVAVGHRDDRTIMLYEVDVRTRRLRGIDARFLETGLKEPYGLCMYVSRSTGSWYVFVCDKASTIEQYELFGAGARVDARLVRRWSLKSQCEGMVADDDTGWLYVGEENVGVWRFRADPDGAPAPGAAPDDARATAPAARAPGQPGPVGELVDRVDERGRLVADVEGLCLLSLSEGRGYLIVSSQGDDAFAVYERAVPNRYVGRFRVQAAKAPITGFGRKLAPHPVTETDGIDATSVPLGRSFPRGAFVAQDGMRGPDDTKIGEQSFVIVPWERIAAALGLRTH